jgi:1-deoxy-D-xylulose-5-phosphate reductoisomerase
VTGLSILGATGSVGASTLDVVRRNADRFRVEALTANTSVELLAEQCLEFEPGLAAVAGEDEADALRARLQPHGLRTEVVCGIEGISRAAGLEEADTVVAAIVGAAGLLPTLAAARAGKRLLLANKETAVMAGDLLMGAVRQADGALIPIDSEHNAVFQCLPDGDAGPGSGISHVLLTASGGPFLDVPLGALPAVTPEQACNHPNWDMGRKISVDSATMMNKGLEVIEACRLFGLQVDQVRVVIHPQSIVHSLVQYRDGSVLAQLGNPDMRTPIAHALGWPERLDAGVEPLDLCEVARLDFRPPDLDRFPCLRLAMEAAASGGAAPIYLNAANEVAVEAFLENRIPFDSIAALIGSVLAKCAVADPTGLEAILELDAQARVVAREYLREIAI